MQEKMPTSSIWKFLLMWMCIWESHLDKSSTSHPEICTSPPALGSEIGGKKTGKPWKTRKIDGRTIGSGDQSWANTTYWICTFSNNQCLLSKPMMFFLQGFLGAFLFVMGLCGWRWIAPLLLYLALSKCDSPRLELPKWWWFQASSLCPRERHQICNSSLLNLKSWCFQRSFSFLVASQGTKLLKSWGVANTRNLPFTWLFIAKACTLLAVDGSSSNNIFCFYLPIGVVCCVYQLPEPTSFIEIMVNVVYIFQRDNFWVLGPW